jgi:hypothetical protein
MPTYLTVLHIYFNSASVYMNTNIYNRVITLQSFQISHLLAAVIFLLNAVVTVAWCWLIQAEIFNVFNLVVCFVCDCLLTEIHL